MPETVSSTTSASSASSCWRPITSGWSRVENFLARTLTKGRAQRESSARSASLLKRMTVTARTVTAFDSVSGIITKKNWICWRSVLARLISCPVGVLSW
jgi:hypothetical protein